MPRRSKASKGAERICEWIEANADLPDMVAIRVAMNQREHFLRTEGLREVQVGGLATVMSASPWLPHAQVRIVEDAGDKWVCETIGFNYVAVGQLDPGSRVRVAKKYVTVVQRADR